MTINEILAADKIYALHSKIMRRDSLIIHYSLHPRRWIAVSVLSFLFIDAATCYATSTIVNEPYQVMLKLSLRNSLNHGFKGFYNLTKNYCKQFHKNL